MLRKETIRIDCSKVLGFLFFEEIKKFPLLNPKNVCTFSSTPIGSVGKKKKKEDAYYSIKDEML